MPISGRCYCGAISRRITGAVSFTSVCHCKDCQTVSGSGFGSTSLMIYDPNGVEFTGKEKPKVFHAESESGNPTERGFCGTCGTVLFNHVSSGRKDEHWAMRTGSMLDSRSLRMEKEIFMKSKLPWVPTVTKADSHYIGMPNAKTGKGSESQKTIEATSEMPSKEKSDGTGSVNSQKTIDETTQTTVSNSEKKRKKDNQKA